MAELHTIVRSGVPGADGTTLGCFLLHGYGANPEDLFDLSSYIPSVYTVIALRAPLVLGPMQYAWFSIDFTKEKPVGNMDEAKSATLLLHAEITRLSKQYLLNPKGLAVVGFSQGAMLAIALGLTHPELVPRVGMLSGRIFPHVEEEVSAHADIRSLDVFVGHGAEDRMVPIDHARHTRTFLAGMGLHADYHEYEAPHAITPQEIEDMVAWLSQSKVM
jgi:phospholipase/carboxylesterase